MILHFHNTILEMAPEFIVLGGPRLLRLLKLKLCGCQRHLHNSKRLRRLLGL